MARWLPSLAYVLLALVLTRRLAVRLWALLRDAWRAAEALLEAPVDIMHGALALVLRLLAVTLYAALLAGATRAWYAANCGGGGGGGVAAAAPPWRALCSYVPWHADNGDAATTTPSPLPELVWRWCAEAAARVYNA